jgi:hypothetical protein
MANSTTTTTTTTGGRAGSAVGGEANSASNNLVGGMDAEQLASQLGIANPKNATAQSILFHIRQKNPTVDPGSVLQMFKDQNGATALIANFGPKTGMESGMDFVASPMSEETGGRPGDAARQARQEMTGSVDTDSVVVPKEGWNEGYAAGSKAAKAGKKNTGTSSLNVSTQGVKANKPPKKSKGEAATKPATAATATAAGAGGGEGDGGGAAVVAEGGDGPKGDDGKKTLRQRMAQPKGGYIDSIINTLGGGLMNEAKGIAKVAAVYGAGDYLIGGPMYKRAMGTADDKEQRIADMLEGKHGYGDESKASWGLGDERIPAGDASAPADKLRKMGTIK